MDGETVDKREELRRRGLREIMQSQSGRAWMHDLLHMHCHIGLCSHVAGCSDSTAFNEGARSVGSSIVQEIIDAHPQHYLKMVEENIAP
jgi:hypothetical protein